MQLRRADSCCHRSHASASLRRSLTSFPTASCLRPTRQGGMAWLKLERHDCGARRRKRGRVSMGQISRSPFWRGFRLPHTKRPTTALVAVCVWQTGLLSCGGGIRQDGPAVGAALLSTGAELPPCARRATVWNACVVSDGFAMRLRLRVARALARPQRRQDGAPSRSSPRVSGLSFCEKADSHLSDARAACEGSGWASEEAARRRRPAWRRRCLCRRPPVRT